jgi:hypothetical protein
MAEGASDRARQQAKLVRVAMPGGTLLRAYSATFAMMMRPYQPESIFGKTNPSG